MTTTTTTTMSTLKRKGVSKTPATPPKTKTTIAKPTAATRTRTRNQTTTATAATAASPMEEEEEEEEDEPTHTTRSAPSRKRKERSDDDHHDDDGDEGEDANLEPVPAPDGGDDDNDKHGDDDGEGEGADSESGPNDYDDYPDHADENEDEDDNPSTSTTTHVRKDRRTELCNNPTLAPKRKARRDNCGVGDSQLREPTRVFIVTSKMFEDGDAKEPRPFATRAAAEDGITLDFIDYLLQTVDNLLEPGKQIWSVGKKGKITDKEAEKEWRTRWEQDEHGNWCIRPDVRSDFNALKAMVKWASNASGMYTSWGIDEYVLEGQSPQVDPLYLLLPFTLDAVRTEAGQSRLPSVLFELIFELHQAMPS